jgi:hypothetical protein
VAVELHADLEEHVRLFIMVALLRQAELAPALHVGPHQREHRVRDVLPVRGAPDLRGVLGLVGEPQEGGVLAGGHADALDEVADLARVVLVGAVERHQRVEHHEPGRLHALHRPGSASRPSSLFRSRVSAAT